MGSWGRHTTRLRKGKGGEAPWKEAVACAAAIDRKIVLIGGEELVALMIDHNIGVTPVTSYEIKRVDTDYFTGE